MLSKPDLKAIFRNFTSGMTARMQFVRFLFVGGINTVFGYSCYALFIFLHFRYPVAMLFSTFLGILFNFATIGNVVFRKARLYLLPKFFMGYVVIYFISVFLLWAIRFFTSNDYLAGLMIVLPMAMISFFLNKYLVFREVI